jgi:serine/threonine protein kinase
MLKPMYTPGFASPEQYSSRNELGPWSDIYSVGASMHACIVGVAPQRADERLKKDLLAPLSRSHAGKYSAPLLNLVDLCLQLDPAHRPQSCYALQKELMRRPTADEHHTPGLLEKMTSALKAIIGKGEGKPS